MEHQECKRCPYWDDEFNRCRVGEWLDPDERCARDANECLGEYYEKKGWFCYE